MENTKKVMTPQQDYIWALYDTAWRFELCSPYNICLVTGKSYRNVPKVDKARSEALSILKAKIEDMAKNAGLTLADIGDDYGNHDEPTRQKAIVQFSLWEDEETTRVLYHKQEYVLLLITEDAETGKIISSVETPTRRDLKTISEYDLARMAFTRYEAIAIASRANAFKSRIYFQVFTKKGRLHQEGDSVGYEIYKNYLEYQKKQDQKNKESYNKCALEAI